MFVTWIIFRGTFKSFWDLTEVSAQSWYKMRTYHLVNPTFISLIHPPTHDPDPPLITWPLTHFFIHPQFHSLPVQPESSEFNPPGMNYGVATISRFLKIMSLCCKRALQKWPYSAKETYHFFLSLVWKTPANPSHWTKWMMSNRLTT